MKNLTSTTLFQLMSLFMWAIWLRYFDLLNRGINGLVSWPFRLNTQKKMASNFRKLEGIPTQRVTLKVFVQSLNTQYPISQCQTSGRKKINFLLVVYMSSISNYDDGQATAWRLGARLDGGLLRLRFYPVSLCIWPRYCSFLITKAQNSRVVLC